MNFEVRRPRARRSKFLARRDQMMRALSYAFDQQSAWGMTPRLRQVSLFIYRIASLRMSRFAAVGALGTVVNLLVLTLLVHGLHEMNYVVAAVIAAEVSILHNFVLQERFVFGDLREGVTSGRRRLAQHLLFNNAEALVRLPFLVLLVEMLHIWAVIAQAATLAVAFLTRFLFACRVVYRLEPVDDVPGSSLQKIPT